MSLAWFEQYPHSVWVTAFLYKDKLIDFRIGSCPVHPFSRTVTINTEEDKDEVFNCKAETKEFIVNSSEEHNEVFSVLAYDWLDQFEKKDGLSFNIDTISKRNIPKIFKILENEKFYQSSINGIPNCYYCSVITDLIKWLEERKENNFLSNNSFYQFKDRYKDKLDNPNIKDDEASILGIKIAYLNRLFNKLKEEIK